MESKKRVAIVTGSNKGIGFEIVKALAKDFDGNVYLTSRNVEYGQKAIQELKKLGLEVKYHQLDIANLESINNFVNYIKENYGEIDVLVNNAAILISKSDNIPIYKEAEDTMKINFFGTLNLCNALFPLLRNNARVVNLSSRLGLLNQVSNKDIKKRILSENLTVEDVIQIVNDYIEACKTEKYKNVGYPSENPSQAYAMSKVALTALTKLQQKYFDSDKTKTGIIVNAVCPGYCKTDMARGGGFLTAKQGAETPVYLSLLPIDFDGPKGVLWAENKPINYESGSLIGQQLGMLKKKIFG